MIHVLIHLVAYAVRALNDSPAKSSRPIPPRRKAGSPPAAPARASMPVARPVAPAPARSLPAPTPARPVPPVPQARPAVTPPSPRTTPSAPRATPAAPQGPPATTLLGIDSLLAQGRVALALERIHVPSLLPKDRHAPRAPTVLVVTSALEAAIRKEPRLERFRPELATLAGNARSVGDLREELEVMPSKQLRHEIAALESRCVRELEHLLADMKNVLPAA